MGGAKPWENGDRATGSKGRREYGDGALFLLQGEQGSVDGSARLRLERRKQAQALGVHQQDTRGRAQQAAHGTHRHRNARNQPDERDDDAGPARTLARGHRPPAREARHVQRLPADRQQAPDPAHRQGADRDPLPHPRADDVQDSQHRVVAGQCQQGASGAPRGPVGCARAPCRATSPTS